MLDAAPRVRHVVEHVLSWVRRELDGRKHDSAARRFIRSTSVANGLPGAAVLGAYSATDSGDASDWEWVWAVLDRSLEQASRAPSLGLYDGLAGLGWAIAHVQHLVGRGRRYQIGASLDDGLLDAVAHGSDYADMHLAEGLCGIGVYWLERLPTRIARRGLRLVVERLNRTAERHPDGAVWLTDPRAMPPHVLAEYPQGVYNLGVPHGQAGIIAFLARTLAAGITPSLTAELLEAAVGWLLSQRASSGVCTLPGRLAPGRRASRGFHRLAWCYGDLGTSLVLVHAARSLGRRDWARVAGELALRSSKRRGAGAGVVDEALLCHGAAGNAHVLARLSQQLGDERLSEAARYWYRRALDMFDSDRWPTGYAFRVADGSRGEALGLLDGVVGVALSLLAATSPVDPAWDRLLAESFPEA